jgi:hypothetical protein
MYMPGDSERFLKKAAGLDVDVVCMDIEDAVAPDRKSVAREMIGDALQTLDFGRSERAVRINAVGTGLAADDINGVLSRDILPDAIVVPKIDNASDIQYVFDEVAKINPSALRLIIMIESAQGLINIREVSLGESLNLPLLFSSLAILAFRRFLTWDPSCLTMVCAWRLSYLALMTSQQILGQQDLSKQRKFCSHARQLSFTPKHLGCKQLIWSILSSGKTLRTSWCKNQKMEL